jgi:RimJ/RimL family protein N-acetyltransferase
VWGEIPAPLVGRIVVVEPLAEEHEEALYAAARFREIFAWMNADPAIDRETFQRWVRDAIAGPDVAFAVLDAATGAPIGSTRYLTLRPEHRGLEIGWTWLMPAAWRTGANVETKLLLLEHAFERLDCIRVEFKTDARNERSRAALEALPARFEGIFRKHMLVRGGELRDSAYYSVVDDDWPAVRANLERRLGFGSVRSPE